ncbi:MAG TPA: HNH endonuclease signature motif containing protein [Gemmatimonadales bacterium]|nr:HNH endonuclease signature motif containing protein [Gemmatimonadales bacterium]
MPTTNKWRIPTAIERAVLERDQSCIYCLVAFSTDTHDRRQNRSWEHIINDLTLVTLENIALCCIRCNSSKGRKTLEEWFQSRYCLDRGIGPDTVAPVVRAVLGQS